MDHPVPFQRIAYGRFDASAGAFFTGSVAGFSPTVTDNGAGDFTFTLATECDATRMICGVQLVEAQAAGGGSASCVPVSDSTVRVTTSNGTALADLDFILWVDRVTLPG